MKSPNPNFEPVLNTFVAGCQTIINKSHEEAKFNFPVDNLSVVMGSRYAKVVRQSPNASNLSVYCFIDKTNGDVLKAATFKQPAKGVRGNIYEDSGLACMTPYGAAYKTTRTKKTNVQLDVKTELVTI